MQILDLYILELPVLPNINSDFRGIFTLMELLYFQQTTEDRNPALLHLTLAPKPSSVNFSLPRITEVRHSHTTPE